MINIGEVINQERKKSGLTLKQLSSKAEISCSYLCDIEKGRSTPSLNTLKKISVGLGINDFNIFLNESYVNIENDNSA